ncbi:hypothetical protein SLS60_002459 [Paraconiothyrium brasiliense]|uniref:Uncharacterized protein n=1 Tax=Paraconiothyrium brasiliense TaxID=300254 RepID=A0ABR3S2R4_9PLEO
MDPLVGDYHFGPTERRAYDALRGGNDEKWAYLVFARAKRHAEDQRMVGHPRRTHKYQKRPFRLIEEWRALDELERHDRVRRARNDPNRPDAVDIQVEFEDPDSPGSIEDFSDVNAGGLTYRFVKTLYKWHYRAVGAPDDVMGSDDRQWSVVRLYSGVDDRGRVRDRVVVKVADWEMPPDPLDADDQDSYDPYAEWRNVVEDEVESLLRKYRRVNGLRQCDHILKPRHWVESDYTYTARDANGNVRFRADGPEMSIRRLGVRSYSDYCELGNLSDIISDYSWENANIEPDDW